MAKDASPKDLERWLLEAIGKIRNQKQRPNVERICAMMQQQCRKVTAKDVASLLDLAIKSHKVVRLESKGGVSYRDASSVHKDSKTARPHSSEAVRKKSDNLDTLVMSTLRASLVGYSIDQIEKLVRKSLQISYETGSDNLRKRVETVCSRLVNEKQLVVEDGLYSVCQLRQCKSPLRTFAADSAEGDDQLSSTTSLYTKVRSLF